MNLLPLWLYLGMIAVFLAAAGVSYVRWPRRESPGVTAGDLVEQYADESLITYMEGESRRHRLRRVQPGQHVRGVWARIR